MSEHLDPHRGYPIGMPTPNSTHIPFAIGEPPMSDLDTALRNVAVAENERDAAAAALIEAQHAQMEAQDRVNEAHVVLQRVIHERKQHLVQHAQA